VVDSLVFRVLEDSEARLEGLEARVDSVGLVVVGLIFELCIQGAFADI